MLDALPILEVKNVTKVFGDRTILKDFNLTVYEGEKIAIIGQSGCGKSTLLRLILGLYHPEEGEVLFRGRNIASMDEKALREVRLAFGILFQSGALFDSISVGENIAFSLIENKHMTYEQALPRVLECLSLVEMEGFEDAMPSSLSGGQKKRIGLARAIAHKPSVTLYDEPTTGSDPVLSTSLEDLMVKLNETQQMTSIVVSHQKSTIFRTVDTIYMMHDGALLSPETPDTILDSDNDIIRHFILGGLSPENAI